MAPVLSIIVPVFNVRAFLPKCLESILSQTFTDFELIIVDDGSDDGSGEICDGFREKDGRIKVIHKANDGVVSARKTGLSAAEGMYVGYVDGDDWIEPQMYENMLGYMEEYNCDLVMCDVTHENKTFPMSSGGTNMDIRGGYYDYDDIKEKILPNMIYAGEFYKFGIYPVIWNKLYKREKLLAHQMAVSNDIKTGEDAACVYPYIFDSKSMYFIKNAVMYHYRYSDTQMTQSYDYMHFEHFKALYTFFSHTAIASSPYSAQLDYYYSYLTKIAVSNELRKENRLPIRQKLKNIKKICAFASDEGFVNRICLPSGAHSLYFRLLRKNKPFLLMLGVYTVRIIQNLLR